MLAVLMSLMASMSARAATPTCTVASLSGEYNVNYQALLKDSYYQTFINSTIKIGKRVFDGKGGATIHEYTRNPNGSFMRVVVTGQYKMDAAGCVATLNYVKKDYQLQDTFFVGGLDANSLAHNASFAGGNIVNSEEVIVTYSGSMQRLY